MARRFRFRLEKILELRLWEEKQAEIKFAAAAGECARLEGQIQALMVRRRDSFRHRLSGGSDITLLLSYEAFGRRLTKEIEEAEKVLAQKTVERDELQALFLEARKKRKVLEKLEEKKRLQFRQEEEKRQVRILDDLNSAAFIRKMETVTHG